MDIKSVSEALAAQKLDHEKSIENFNSELRGCRAAGYRKRAEIRNDVDEIVNTSETNMAEYFKESIVRQDLLRLETREVEERLKELRHDDILAEKVLKDKRCRVESDLLNQVARYDNDIGDRHSSMENFSEIHRALKSERKALEDDVMVNLRTLHDELQLEKAETLLKIRNEKVERFVRNRAAIVVQRAWRAFSQRRWAKKKKKSRKK
ncbi:uncharacterized protein LOC105683268 [Athalia rosae]|uniref:uncharacterized protein LOC105683268 n=1 Tax=Athalia rosae TaxID=37344 RepID=UPI0020332A53|nr:uncharacterized protein LOC105683268 [Athalia rosae]